MTYDNELENIIQGRVNDKLEEQMQSNPSPRDDVADLRGEMRAGFARIEGSITTLSERVNGSIGILTERVGAVKTQVSDLKWILGLVVAAGIGVAAIVVSLLE